MKLKKAVPIALLTVWIPLASSFAGSTSSFVSLYQYKREYRLLERSKEIGLIRRTDLSFKPLSRTDFARAIVEIYNNRNIAPILAKKKFIELYP